MRQTHQPAVEMRHLRLIAAVAEHGSMTLAAGALNLTQPALSHQLRELETRLRTPLFVRTTRRMVPTAAGEQLLGLARAVLSQVDSFERQVLDGELTVPRGSIRIATQCHTAYHWLPALLRSFRDRWPSVELHVDAAPAPTPVAALREGALDLAIVYSKVDDRRVRFDPLFDDELVLVTARDHHLAKREYVPIESIADEHLFIYSSTTRHSVIMQDVLEPAGVTPRQVTRVHFTEAIIELVAAGLGVAILARWAVLPAVRSRSLSIVRLGRGGVSRTWYAATRSGDVTPAYQVDLIELLKRHLHSWPTKAVVPGRRSGA